MLSGTSAHKHSPRHAHVQRTHPDPLLAPPGEAACAVRTSVDLETSCAPLGPPTSFLTACT
eukprot:358020-Chlamydomonas_euryale.AAC.16